MANSYLQSHSWRCVKGDYLYHFSLPRVDLLAWVLITKLVPMYYRKLEIMLNDIGHFRELPKWRKDFKAEWIKAMMMQITMPLNKKYRPATQRFVCTCPQFVTSRSLLCKHLVQQFQPVDPRFFLEVTRNHCLPFWSHPSLKPLAMPMGTREPDADHPATADGEGAGEVYNRLNLAGYGLEDDDGLVDTEERVGKGENNVVKEKMEDYIRII